MKEKRFIEHEFDYKELYSVSLDKAIWYLEIIKDYCDNNGYKNPRLEEQREYCECCGECDSCGKLILTVSRLETETEAKIAKINKERAVELKHDEYLKLKKEFEAEYK